MTNLQRGLIRGLILASIAAVLFFIFPHAAKIAEAAARELRYLWWVVLLVALAIWLIWGFGKKR